MEVRKGEPAGRATSGPSGEAGRNPGYPGTWLEGLPPPPSLRSDLVLFGLLGALGVVASYISVNIPHTEVFFEVRFAFGFMGFALIHRGWLALGLALVLCLAGEHKVSLLTAFLANLVYTLPNLALIRFVHGRILERTSSLLLYGAGWFALVLVCYQIFSTPGVGLILAWLRNEALVPFAVEFWRTQPYLIESVLTAIISTAGLVVLRSYRAVAHKQHELDVTLQSIGDAVIATDTNGRITRINPEALALTGWTAEAALGRPVDDILTLFNSRTRAPVETPVARVLAEGRTVGMANHTTLRARDGTERQIADSAAPIRDTDGEMLGIVMVFRDVSPQYAAHEALLHSKRQLDLALDSAGMGVWDWDVATGMVALGGWQADLLGFEPGLTEVDVQAFESRVHPEDWEETWAASTLAAQGSEQGPNDLDITFRVLREGGGFRWVRTVGRAIRGIDGAVTRVIGTAQDVTERVAGEEQLQCTVDALTRSNMELERFAYIASHDLQEPIRNMVAYSQLLSQRYGPHLDDDALTFLGFIVDGAKRMQALVLDLLDYSRVSSRGRPLAAVDLNAVVGFARENLREAIHDSGASLDVDPLPVVQGDHMQLVSLMQNLIGNAIKFRRPDVAPVIRIRGAVREDRTVIVEVIDNGIGIPAADRDRVFQIFRRLHSARDYPGTGIGLAIAQRIVERHGGRIGIEDMTEPGACFRIELPCPEGVPET